MSAVYNPQADLMAEIDRLAADARDLRRRIQHAAKEEDRRVLRHQLSEIEQQISTLQARLAA